MGNDEVTQIDVSNKPIPIGNDYLNLGNVDSIKQRMHQHEKIVFTATIMK